VQDGTISVVIPTYNCAALLPNAIRSAYAQTLAPAEVVVVDDGCTDNTADVVESLAPSLPDNFTYIRQANGGEAAARNRGVSVARGTLVAFLDQDDVWLPDKLERQAPLFQTVTAPALTFTAYTRVSGATRELVSVRGWQSSREYVLRQLMQGCCITPSTVIVRKDVLDAVGPFNESFWLGNDWDMWIRIAMAGYPIEYLPVALTDYLWHENNMSRDQRKIADAALRIFPALFRSDELPPEIKTYERECLARWNLIAACSSLESGQGRDCRRSLEVAFRTRPTSVRPGWALLYAKSFLGRRIAQAGARDQSSLNSC
jgi:glycosyltransferase involved in cell wall biosynthesis